MHRENNRRHRHRNYVLNSAPITQEIRARIDKWDSNEEGFCTSKQSITKTKRKPTE
jgi:hypothetical protein